MILGKNVGSVFSEGREIKKVYSLGKLVWEKKTEPVIDYSTIPFTIKAIDDNVEISAKTIYGSSVSLEYIINGGDTQSGDIIYIRQGDALSIKMYASTICFNIKGLCDVYGNIMSISYGEDFVGKTMWDFNYSNGDEIGLFEECDIRDAKNLKLPEKFASNAALKRMFYGCTSLTHAPELPATTLAPYCYSQMFRGCTSLTTPPSLPSTKLANGCYSQMFYGCTSLTHAPELPATTFDGVCYAQMFSGCTSLTHAPELPATTLTNYCYREMFYGCTSLTHAPELPATTLEQFCYLQMFEGCTSLTHAPELPATTLRVYCYAKMFSGCTSLTHAPELPATTLTNGCYSEMFNECIKLNYVKIYAKEALGYMTHDTFNNVSPTGTLVCYKSSAGVLKNEIPSTWTIEYID